LQNATSLADCLNDKISNYIIDDQYIDNEMIRKNYSSDILCNSRKYQDVQKKTGVRYIYCDSICRI